MIGVMGSTSSTAELANRAFTRILLIKPSSLGDVVHALPVLHGLRRRYPTARIDWLISSSLAEFLAPQREVDRLILFDRDRFGSVGRHGKVTADFVRFLGELRDGRYDLAIDLQGLLRTGFFAWASRAPVRLGFRNAREGAPIFYTHCLSDSGREIHAVDRNYKVARALGFGDVPICFNLHVAEPARQEAKDLLGPLSPCRPRQLMVAPGARWETKIWPAERYVETIHEVRRRGWGRSVLLGSPDEAARCEAIARACPADTVNLGGKTSLPTMAAVLEQADAVLCHDSAVLHVAVALNRPIICIVGPTNPARTGPYRRPDAVVRLPLDCSPCYFRRLSQCPYDHRCMRELDVPTVVEAIRKRTTQGDDA